MISMVFIPFVYTFLIANFVSWLMNEEQHIRKIDLILAPSLEWPHILNILLSVFASAFMTQHPTGGFSNDLIIDIHYFISAVTIKFKIAYHII